MTEATRLKLAAMNAAARAPYVQPVQSKEEVAAITATITAAMAAKAVRDEAAKAASEEYRIANPSWNRQAMDGSTCSRCGGPVSAGGSRCGEC